VDVDRESGVCGMKRDPSELPNDALLATDAPLANAARDHALGRALRSLPRRMPPPGLTSSLRVLASRERRRRVYGSGSAFADRVRLFCDNLMRPLALPFAGGVFSTVVLFSMWLGPSYTVRASSTVDVPTGLATEASIRKTAPIAESTADVIVDIAVDGQGRMIDYSIVSGNCAKDEAMRRRIEGMLLLIEFNPATSFGQPVEGRMRLSLSASHIDVKG
jgi:hypothetical protein